MHICPRCGPILKVVRKAITATKKVLIYCAKCGTALMMLAAPHTHEPPNTVFRLGQPPAMTAAGVSSSASVSHVYWIPPDDPKV
jgi:hypothetical protein